MLFTGVTPVRTATAPRICGAAAHQPCPLAAQGEQLQHTTCQGRPVQGGAQAHRPPVKWRQRSMRAHGASWSPTQKLQPRAGGPAHPTLGHLQAQGAGPPPSGRTTTLRPRPRSTGQLSAPLTRGERPPPGLQENTYSTAERPPLPALLPLRKGASSCSGLLPRSLASRPRLRPPCPRSQQQPWGAAAAALRELLPLRAGRKAALPSCRARLRLQRGSPVGRPSPEQERHRRRGAGAESGRGGGGVEKVAAMPATLQPRTCSEDQP